ncbi:MAG: hypothetical protein OHK0022_58580 [Roseiflexaceae bacterium]
MAALVISTDAPVVAGPPQGQWAYADWETLPEDGNRYEVITLHVADLFSGAPDTTL